MSAQQTDEQIVRTAWEELYVYDFANGGGNIRILIPGVKWEARPFFSGKNRWSDAREFTEERKEEIKELKEEIAFVAEHVNHWRDPIKAIQQRTLARLQVELTELERGMKVEA